MSSNILFHRPPTMKPFPVPAAAGNLELLDKYLNISDSDKVLAKAWLAFTLSSPKIDTASYVHLVLGGDQGTGKTHLCNIIRKLVDPNIVGAMAFPQNKLDIVIAAQHAHLLCYDNLRYLSPDNADILCIASTGGAMSSRQLYSNDGQHVHHIHVPIIFNGIHPFINTPDLSQRCLPITLKPLTENDRKSESEMAREFESVYPAIFRGLLELIADIFTHLPTVEITDPTRMLDFSRCLAAYEKVAGVPVGVYQGLYSSVIKESQLDTLLSDPVAETLFEYFHQNKTSNIEGTPSEVLKELSTFVNKQALYSRSWPKSASAFSKRLISLKAGLRTQGVAVILERGKHRSITITKLGVN